MKTIAALIASLAAVATNYAQNTPWPASGNVGIGTTNPQVSLQVMGAIYAGTSDDPTGGLYFGGPFNGLIVGKYSTSPWPGLNGLYVGGTTLLNGSVGIGTTNPVYRLQIQKTSVANPAIMIGGGYYGGPRLQTYGLDADANAWMGLGTDMGGGPYEHSIYFSDYNGMGFLSFGTYNGSTYSEKMRLTRLGSLGIGTTSPVSQLEISALTPILTLTPSGYNGSYRTTLGTRSGAEGFLTFGNNGQNEIRAGRSVAGGYLEFFTNNTVDQFSNSDGNFVMRMAANGYVGIGTRSPTEKLSVNGRIRAKEVIVDTNWSDYVFAKDYKLAPLSEVEQHIEQQGHLPGVPSAQEVAAKGSPLATCKPSSLQRSRS